MAAREFGEDYLPPGYIPGQYSITHSIPHEEEFDIDRIVEHVNSVWEVPHNGDKFGRYVQIVLYHPKKPDPDKFWQDVFIGIRLDVPGREKLMAFRRTKPWKRDSMGKTMWKEGWKDVRQLLLFARQELQKETEHV
jgi:hypothetical protein